MFSFVKHLLLPHQGNNQRAKILHNSSLFVVFVSLMFLSFSVYFVKLSNPEVLGISYSVSETELLALVNEERARNNLPPLVLDTSLEDAARRKASDMFSKNYWAHFAPDGTTTPWKFIKDSGYNYTVAGENLAKGFTDSGSIVNAWMASQTHRDNILSSKYHDVGFAIVEGNLQGEDTLLVVEMFGSKQFSAPAPIAQVAEASQVIVEATPSSQGSTLGQEQKPASPKTIVKSPQIDVGITTKAASTIGLSFFAFFLAMDLVIVERKKIPRFVGHNLDHIILIMTFILFVVILKSGVIL